MRIPLPAVLAILAIAAAGTIVLNVTYKQAYYTVNASGLAVGQNMTVTLSDVPYQIYVLGNPSAKYYVLVNITGAWVDYMDMGYYLVRVIEDSVYGNSTVPIGRVVRVDGPITCKITVERVS